MTQLNQPTDNPDPPSTAIASASPTGGAVRPSIWARVARYVPEKLRTPLCYLLVLFIGCGMYMANYPRPYGVFWDENYHITAVERYVERVAFFGDHPPLSKLLMAAGEVVSRANARIDKRELTKVKWFPGEKLPKGYSFAGMRFVSSLFGGLGALWFFALMRQLTANRLHALLFSSLYLFENAYIVHFRAVHLDSYQMFFALGALWLFVRLWKQSGAIQWPSYVGMAALCTLSVMTKVNSVVLFALIAVLFFKDAGTRSCKRRVAAHAFNFLSKSVPALVASAAIAFAVFAVHVGIANKLPSTNDAVYQDDRPFMSATYRDYLEHRRPLSAFVVVAYMKDSWNYMQAGHLGVPKLDVCKPDENGSPPWSWPFLNKTITYRWDLDRGIARYVHLTGNAISWDVGIACVFLSLITIANRRLFGIPAGNAKAYALIEVFTGFYAVFMSVHLWLGSLRVMYLYHYFIGLLISYLLIVLNWQNLCDLRHVTERTRTKIAAGFALAVIGSCVFYLPLTNHYAMTYDQCQWRNFFGHVVHCVK